MLSLNRSSSKMTSGYESGLVSCKVEQLRCPYALLSSQQHLGDLQVRSQSTLRGVCGCLTVTTAQGTRKGEAGPDAVKTIEPGVALTKRLMSFWEERLNSIPPNETSRRVLFVSHGGAIRHLVEDLVVRRREQYTVDLPGTHEQVQEALSRRLGNCCITEFVCEEIEPGQWRGRMTKYADEEHFIESSRAPSPSENVDIID